LSLDNGEIKLCPKLSHQHWTVYGRDRQFVRLACQLFSNQVSQAISYLMLEERGAAEFIKLINDVFDILNSRITVNDANRIASGFGLQLEIQEGLLRRF
jgi:hypothetical protein